MIQKWICQHGNLKSLNKALNYTVKVHLALMAEKVAEAAAVIRPINFYL